MNNILYKIIHKNNSESKDIAGKIQSFLNKKGWKVDEQLFHYVFAIGGDGSFIKALSSFFDRDIKFIHINTGNIGFYSSLNWDNFENNFEKILEEKYFFYYDIVSAQVGNKKIYAANDIFISSSLLGNVEVRINDTLLCNAKANGFLISTKNGSTGYMKSLGGSIILSKNNIHEFKLISPAGFKKWKALSNSIIVDNQHTVSCLFDGYHADVSLVNDGYVSTTIKNGEKISFKVFKSEAKIFRVNELKFYLQKLNEVF